MFEISRDDCIGAYTNYELCVQSDHLLEFLCFKVWNMTCLPNCAWKTDNGRLIMKCCI